MTKTDRFITASLEKENGTRSTYRAHSFCCVLNNVDKLFDIDSDFFEDSRFSDKTRKRVEEFRKKLPKPGYPFTPKAMIEILIDFWMEDSEDRSCAVNYEIGEDGVHHCHMILEGKQAIRFSALQKLYPTIHAELTRGTKEEVFAYLNKTGKHEEKAHTIVVPMVIHGEIRASKQGKRTDLEIIEQLLEEGQTPEEIMSQSLSFRRFSKLIKEHYYQMRLRTSPRFKDSMEVVYHVGASRSGKSYQQIRLMEEFGDGNVYVWSDYQNGGLDTYLGEKILFMEEFKGELSYQEFLRVTDSYVQQFHARFTNIYALWEKVHISSIFPPKELYKLMVSDSLRATDTMEQMMLRISKVVYHFKVKNKGEIQFKSLTMSIEDFNNHTMKQIETFAHQFDKSNPDVLDYNFETDAFLPTMLPIKYRKKKATTSKPTKAGSDSPK
ncbi:replication protein RepA [Streptococcus suis]|uniref:replication protein RepA n=1 Tax=Streptococcus suis TaxID=1307 RepID=UPI001581D039|nr:replication protein RepA [Streptococcus suis]HEM6145335.1 replication protein RepA [Streptococcus suis]HEM6362943.1 replication protein RepA [Streptococcus suis]HEM6402883.1 replication protein RepA [Streptococcus suis]